MIAFLRELEVDEYTPKAKSEQSEDWVITIRVSGWVEHSILDLKDWAHPLTRAVLTCNLRNLWMDIAGGKIEASE
jgi:hypothetical protein